MSDLRALVFYCILASALAEDLYNVLGVRKGASTQEIKSAYKKLAKEWHPDKNKDPEATERFTKINEAYETLGDADKRRDYDNYGYTSAQERPPPQQPDFGFPFEEFFSGFGFKGFGGNKQGPSVFDKHLTSLRNFETKLQPESQYTPCFIYAFSDFCFNCMRMEHILEKFFEEMENIGLCVSTIHIQRNPDLASHLRIQLVPALLGMVHGRITHMRGDIISIQHLREFVRQLFPKETLTMLTDDSADRFLQGWQNNQVTAVFFSPRLEPSARFLAPAFFHRDRVAFAFVSTSSDDAREFMRRFNINKHRESLLVFNEETASPVASISVQQLTRSTMDEVISSNRYLSLPRLSSQAVFEELCPKEPKIKRRKLCVALITSKIPDHDVHRERFRQFVISSTSIFNTDRVRFVYLYEDVQKNVMEALTKGNSTRTKTVLEVAILWHLDDSRVSYEFLEQGWSLDANKVGDSRAALEKRLIELLESDHLLAYRAIVPAFYNEHTLSLVRRIFLKILDWGDRVWFFLSGYHPTTWLMTVMGVVFVGVFGIVMKKMADAEEAQVRSQQKSKRKQTRPPSSTDQTIHLYELRYETFNNLVKEADTGLTIVMLVDEESKAHLLQKFAEIMQPYSRYSALTFGYVQLEYYVSWYQHLLEMSMNFKVKLDSINIRNCVGTVLALNGYRKYYYIYHPRRAQKWIRAQNRVVQAMGFMDSDSESDDDKKMKEHILDGADTDRIFMNEVLSGLAMWMDRIFDGSVRKVRIGYWPEMSP